MGWISNIASELLVKAASDDALLKMLDECLRKERHDEGNSDNNYKYECIQREICRRGLSPH